MNSYQCACKLQEMNGAGGDFLLHKAISPIIHDCYVWYFTRATLAGKDPPKKETVILWVLSDYLDITKHNKPFAQGEEREPAEYIGVPHQSDPLPPGAY